MVSAGQSQFIFQITWCDRHQGQVHCGSVVLHRGWICWKRNAVKQISPGLLVLVLFSETMSFVVSADDEKGLKLKRSRRLQTGSVSIPCCKWAYLLFVPKY